MKSFKLTIGAILFNLGVILFIFANVIGIGYGLYLWGAEGLTLGTSAWLAFVLWLKTLGLSAISIILGLFLHD